MVYWPIGQKGLHVSVLVEHDCVVGVSSVKSLNQNRVSLSDGDGEVGGLVRLNIDGVNLDNVEGMTTHVDMEHCGQQQHRP